MPPLGTVKTHTQELYDMQHSTESLGSSPMSVIVAAGPYTLDNNLNYEPFDALMTQVERKQPDVVILVRHDFHVAPLLIKNNSSVHS